MPREPRTTSSIERRAFLQKAGLGAAVAGAAWVAPSVVGFDVAFAGASCAQQDTLNWNDYTSGSAFTSKNYAVVGPYAALTVTLSVTTVGTPSAYTGNKTVQNGPFGGVSANYWLLAMQNNAVNEGYDATFTFSRAVSNLRFTLLDIDRWTNLYQDKVWIAGAAFNATKANAQVTGSGTSADPWLGSATGGVADTSTAGNVAVVMPTVTSFTISYRSSQYLGQPAVPRCRQPRLVPLTFQAGPASHRSTASCYSHPRSSCAKRSIRTRPAGSTPLWCERVEPPGSEEAAIVPCRGLSEAGQQAPSVRDRLSAVPNAPDPPPWRPRVITIEKLSVPCGILPVAVRLPEVRVWVGVSAVPVPPAVL